MGNSFQIAFAGQAADDTFTTVMTAIEVEEGMDIPSALQITLPVTRSDAGDLAYVSDPRFQPMAAVTLVASAGGTGACCAPARSCLTRWKTSTRAC